jgi:NADH dehydrogenase [ubiquinone] 1 alpha subcomplex assembly factor 7
VSDAAEHIAALIHREGPIPFDRFMEAALYGEGGFFTEGHGAGRAGRDFVTSPEVGSLFGACVAEALDGWWHELGEPDPFLVVEAGAGNGRLARDILRASPQCTRALRYVLVERSPALRAEQRTRVPIEPPEEALGPFARAAGSDAPVPDPAAGPVFTSLEELPPVDAPDGVVFSNELLDNLAFGIAQYDGDRWNEIRVAVDNDRFVEVAVPLTESLDLDVPAGTRAPIPSGLRTWFAACDRVLRCGRIVVVDYMTPAADLPGREWLRTYRAHGRGSGPLDAPGTQDITGDVVLEQLIAAAPGMTLSANVTQAEWLHQLGIDARAEAGARRWEAGAHRGDLDALAGRSQVVERAALTDPSGLGAHRVVVLTKGARR